MTTKYIEARPFSPDENSVGKERFEIVNVSDERLVNIKVRQVSLDEVDSDMARQARQVGVDHAYEVSFNVGDENGPRMAQSVVVSG